MSTNPESFDAALADLCEFVDFNRQCFDPPVVMRCAVASELEGVARRLKAAHKREVDDAERRGHHAATKACCETIEKAGPFYDAESVGNSAKLRAALKKILLKAEKLQGIDPSDNMTMAGGLSIIRELARAALAAPARNCDLFSDARAAESSFDAFCLKMKSARCMPALCKLPSNTGAQSCLVAWLFASAARSDARNKKEGKVVTVDVSAIPVPGYEGAGIIAGFDVTVSARLSTAEKFLIEPLTDYAMAFAGLVNGLRKEAADEVRKFKIRNQTPAKRKKAAK